MAGFSSIAVGTEWQRITYLNEIEQAITERLSFCEVTSESDNGFHLEWVTGPYPETVRYLRYSYTYNNGSGNINYISGAVGTYSNNITPTTPHGAVININVTFPHVGIISNTLKVYVCSIPSGSSYGSTFARFDSTTTQDNEHTSTGHTAYYLRCAVDDRGGNYWPSRIGTNCGYYKLNPVLDAFSTTVAGTEIQSSAFWSERQKRIDQLIIGTTVQWAKYTSTSAPTSLGSFDDATFTYFANTAELWAKVHGGTAPRRRTTMTGYPSSGWLYGYCQPGDIIGYWILSDMQNALKFLRHPAIPIPTSNAVYNYDTDQHFTLENNKWISTNVVSAEVSAKNEYNSIISANAPADDLSDMGYLKSTSFGAGIEPLLKAYPYLAWDGEAISDYAISQYPSGSGYWKGLSQSGMHWQAMLQYNNGTWRAVGEWSDFEWQMAGRSMAMKYKVYAVCDGIYAVMGGPAKVGETSKQSNLSEWMTTIWSALGKTSQGLGVTVSYRYEVLGTNMSQLNRNRCKLLLQSTASYTSPSSLGQTKAMEQSGFVRTWDDSNLRSRETQSLTINGFAVTNVFVLTEPNWARA